MKNEMLVKEEISINAPAGKVWEVLTHTKYYRQWEDLPEEFNDENLNEGSVIAWKGQSELTVTRFEENKLLEMSLKLPQVDLDPEDYDISYLFTLSSDEGQTSLQIKIGDFAPLPNSQDYLRSSTQFARLAKQKIKELAEK